MPAWRQETYFCDSLMNSGTKLTIFKVSSHSTPGLISISLYSATADGGYKLLTLAVKLLTVDFNSCLVL